ASSHARTGAIPATANCAATRAPSCVPLSRISTPAARSEGRRGPSDGAGTHNNSHLKSLEPAHPAVPVDVPLPPPGWLVFEFRAPPRVRYAVRLGVLRAVASSALRAVRLLRRYDRADDW